MRVAMRFAWLFAPLVAACTARPPPGAPVQCGSSRCGAAQYCAEVCTCCGIDSGEAPSGYEECREIPEACNGISDAAELAGCLAHETGGQSESTAPLLVAFPCA